LGSRRKARLEPALHDPCFSGPIFPSPKFSQLIYFAFLTGKSADTLRAFPFLFCCGRMMQGTFKKYPEKYLKLRTMFNKHKAQRLFGMSILFFVLLNYPLLRVFGHQGTIMGIPTLYVSIFAIWAAIIGWTIWIIERK